MIGVPYTTTEVGVWWLVTHPLICLTASRVLLNQIHWEYIGSIAVLLVINSKIFLWRRHTKVRIFKPKMNEGWAFNNEKAVSWFCKDHQGQQLHDETSADCLSLWYKDTTKQLITPCILMHSLCIHCAYCDVQNAISVWLWGLIQTRSRYCILGLQCEV